MLRPSRAVFVLCLFVAAAVPIAARNRSRPEPGTPLVTVSASGDQVRLTALALARRMRLEVLSHSGDSVYDSGWHPGNRLETQLRNHQGSELADGLYGCLVTVENLDGNTSSRAGVFRVLGGAASFDTDNREDATTSSSDGEDLTILGTADALPFTLVSHDGNEGLIESASGGLSFTVRGLKGDRSEVPQMRLTAEGNLGIGVAEPQAKVDVAGLIRASEGFQFADGTVLKLEDGSPVLVTGNPGGESRTPPSAKERTKRLLATDGNTRAALTTRDSPSAVFAREDGAPLYNTVYGADAGSALTSGYGNSLFGAGAGSTITTEGNNSFIGAYSSGAAGVANAAAIGYRARVTASNSLVLGAIAGVNGAESDTNVGIGVNSPSYRLHVQSAFPANVYGGRAAASYTLFSPASNADGYVFGLESNARYQGSVALTASHHTSAAYALSALTGYYGGTVSTGATGGSVGTVSGVTAQNLMRSGITVADAIGVHIQPASSDVGPASVGNVYGVYVKNPYNVAPSNVYGLYTEGLTSGTNNFGVYVSGSTPSYFGGRVGIGTSTPASALTVSGNVEVQGAGNGVRFADGTVLTSGNAARIRAITYLGGCDTCSLLADTDDQRTIFVNLVGAMTINSVTCFSDAGSPTINVQRDGGVPANILSAALTCSTGGATSTAIAPGQTTLNLNDHLHFVMVTAGGTARRVTVIVKATVN